jgi:hypothetical protein
MAERRPIVLIGNTLHELADVDTLTGFYNSTEIDLMFNNFALTAVDIDLLVSKMPVYTKDQTQDLLSYKADKTDVYNRSELNGMLVGKANASDVYDKNDVYHKSETYSKLEAYPKVSLYTRTEIDDLFVQYGALTADDVYNKLEVNDMFDNFTGGSGDVTTNDLNIMKSDIMSLVSADYQPRNSDLITKVWAEQNFTTITNTYTRTEIDDLLPDSTSFATQTWVNGKIIDLLSGAGAINIDLSNYYTKSQVMDKIDDALVNLDSSGGIDLNNYYNKLESLQLIQVELADYNTKTEITGKFDSYYTRTQIDNLFADFDGGIANIDLSNYYTKDVADLKVEYAIQQNALDMSIYYNKVEVNNILTLDYYNKSQIHAYVDNAIDDIDLTGLGGGTIDLDALNDFTYTKDYINATFISINSSLLEQKLSDYSLVTSVYTKQASDSLYTTQDDFNSRKNNVDSYISTINTSIQTLNTQLGLTEDILGGTFVDTTNRTNRNKLEIFKLIKKVEATVEFLDGAVPEKVERDLITVSNPAVKTYSVDYNPKNVYVYLNRNVLYKEEYTALDGDTITFNIDLLINDKIKVFTEVINFDHASEFALIDALTEGDVPW